MVGVGFRDMNNYTIINSQPWVNAETLKLLDPQHWILILHSSLRYYGTNLHLPVGTLHA